MEMKAFASAIYDAAELNTIPDKRTKSLFIVDTVKNGRFLVCINIRKLKEKKKKNTKADMSLWNAVHHFYCK